MSLDYNEYSPYPKFKSQSPYLPNKFLPDELQEKQQQYEQLLSSLAQELQEIQQIKSMLLQPAKPFPGSETGQFQAPEEDENVEGYIWDSLQRNQQRL
jgi:hypothetical protein